MAGAVSSFSCTHHGIRIHMKYGHCIRAGVLLLVCGLLLACTRLPIPDNWMGTPPLTPDETSPYAAVPYTDPQTLEKLRTEIRYIVHAAGEIDGTVGSNSMEGLQNAYDAGERYIELDFNFTADGHLACIHDWYVEYTSAILENGHALTLAEFRAAKIYDRLTPLDLDTLAAFLAAHADLYIITDIKDDNIAGLSYIAASYPELIGRFIPQIYAGDEYDRVRELGYEYVIYTLYRLDWNSKTDVEALCAYAAGHPLLAYTFSYELCAVDGYVSGMRAAGIPLYIHTVNDPAEMETYREMGISAFYTDKVLPDAQ